MTILDFPEWVYHGTYLDKSNNEPLNSFKTQIANTSHWRGYKDFGPGLYTTIDYRQAQYFAKLQASRRGLYIPIVLQLGFKDADFISKLKGYIFLGASFNWSDYILGNRIHNQDNINKEVIVGPMADNQISKVVAEYNSRHKDDKEWFYRQITRDNKIQGLQLGNQIVFKDVDLTNKLLFLNGWYIFDGSGWGYNENI